MKTSAPLMSLQASGTFANLITASRWKGRPYLRERVTPSNPRTQGQINIRGILGAIAKGATAVLTSFADMSGVGSVFFVSARDQAPSGQSWISFLQKKMAVYGGQQLDTDWSALGGTKQGYFNTTGTAVDLSTYTPSFGTPESYSPTGGGQQLFILATFASLYLTGTIKTLADTAIAGASQGDVDDFGDAVHLTS